MEQDHLPNDNGSNYVQEQNHFCDNDVGPDKVLPTNNRKTSEPDGVFQISNAVSDVPLEPRSVYTFFKEAAERYRDQPALLVKRDDNWKKWTYSEYFADCCTVAKALIKLGLERLHGVCIMGYNSPEWILANFGAIFAGGFSSGVYTTNSPEVCFSLAENCEAQIVIVENKTCLDKFLAVKDKLPHIKAIIQWMDKPENAEVISWEDMMALGLQQSDDLLIQRLSTAVINQCCTLIYTSGTTGPPKGVMLSQDHMTWIARRFRHVYEKASENVVVSYLPLSHLAGQIADIYTTIEVGAAVYIAPRDALKGTLGAFLLEVRPTVFLGVPRIWEKMFVKLNQALVEAGTLKKSLLSWAMAQSSNYYEALQKGRELSVAERWKYYGAKTLVLNKIKQAVGLDRAHTVVTGSAPLSTEIMDFFLSLDLPLLEGYGLSESTGTCSLNSIEPLGFKIGSVGKIREVNEVRLIQSDDFKEGEGEICIRGRNVCMGYLRKPDKTDEAIDAEGWLHTGDVGRIDDNGFLFITGRLKELVITSGGENVPPIPIENSIKKALPCVSNAMLVGDRRKYLSVLLTFKSEVDPDTGNSLQELTTACRTWLTDHGCSALTVAEAIKEIEENPTGLVANAVQEAVDSYNCTDAISNAQKVQRWTFLPHDFSLPTGELNSTLKLKRAFVMQKYAHVIDTMYSKQDNSVL